MSHAIPKLVGAYEVLGRLSTGGMGTVLLGRKQGAHGLQRLAAIKTLLAGQRDNEHLRSMFLDEARLLARLGHPAIAQMYDFVEQDGQLYLIMEYVAGVSFERLIELRPPPLVAASLVAAVCRGLHAAHQLVDEAGRPLGVVHRDVSPQNLMLTFEGWVKILDFGIALVRDRQARVTQINDVKGKPGYMAPEQVQGSRIDHRTDIFAAGILLHELVTGRSLFRGGSPYGVARAIVDGPIPLPSEVCGPLPEGLDQIALTALSRVPAERFSSALSMAQALDALTAGPSAEPLEHYARRELAPAREQHAQSLQRVLVSPSLPPRAIGRPEGVATIGSPAHPKLPAEVTAPLAPVGLRAQQPSRWKVLLVALSLVAVLGTCALWFWRDGQRSSATVMPKSSEASAPVVVTASVTIGRSLEAEVTQPPAEVAPAKTYPRPRRRGGASHHSIEASTSSPQAPRQGFLTVAARPYALVSIDGQHIGPTPILEHRLAVGLHEVLLVSPDTGELRHRERVTIVADTTRTVLVK